MEDLFSNVETLPNRKKGNVYKARNGKFTDKVTAEVDGIVKERDRYKLCFEYWRRQAERLSEEVKAEHLKVLELEAKLRGETHESIRDSAPKWHRYTSTR